MSARFALTIDEEWAHLEVLDDLFRELDARGLSATLFCTNPGPERAAHERAIHPNFRRAENTLLRDRPDVLSWSDDEYYRWIVARTKQFCPEATGVRAHHLFSESVLLGVYREAGITYSSNQFLPLVQGLAPVSRLAVLELPVYYMDHWDAAAGATGFRISALQLDQPGLKVFDFHPNLVYVNARSVDDYERTRAVYSDPEQLLRHRATGRGVRTLWLELLDYLAARRTETLMMGEMSRLWGA